MLKQGTTDVAPEVDGQSRNTPLTLPVADPTYAKSIIQDILEKLANSEPDRDVRKNGLCYYYL